MRTHILFPSILLFTVSIAHAEDREAARIRRQLDSLAGELPKVDPEPGRAKAKVQKPPWCDVVKTGGRPSPSYIARSMTSGSWLGAAELTCEWPDEPAIQQAVARIVQRWINTTGLAEAQAIEAWHARMNTERFKADKVALCDQLAIPAEVDGEVKVFMQTRRDLFGCVKKGEGDNQPPLWDGPGYKLHEDLITFLDLSVTPADELVRLAWVVHRSRGALKQTESFVKELPRYVVDQIDYQALSASKVKSFLDIAPYKGNVYARTIILETLARAQMSIEAFQTAVKQKAADADWKELLVTAPARGAAEWSTKAKQHEQAIARSNEFEDKFWGPSRKALKGCWPELRKDYIVVLQTLKRGTVNEVKEAFSDPIASLLLSRLATCAAVDLQNKDYAMSLGSFAKTVRYARGPRLAAYYASLDALSKILVDRSKFPLTADDFYFQTHSALLDEADSLYGKARFFTDHEKGVVKAVKKVANGVQITWVTVKHQEMGVDCSNTNRISHFSGAGQVVYHQNCVGTGMVAVDDTPNGIIVPTEFADGIAAGAAVEFDASADVSQTRSGMPTAVYKDKTKKTLVSAQGFPL